MRKYLVLIFLALTSAFACAAELTLFNIPLRTSSREEIRDAITQALLGLANSEAGRQMLGRVPMPKPVVTNMQDYLPMRQWGLDRYWVE